MTDVIIAGCGYVGQRLAKVLLDRGQPVQAVVRSGRSEMKSLAVGVDAVRLDFDDDTPLPPEGISGALIYYLVPTPDHGDDDPRLANFLACLEPLPNRLVYISTTGVYGDCEGASVTEARTPNPATPRAKRRVAAENLARQWCDERGVECVILRVPGIYGPARLPVSKLETGDAVINADEAPPGNRIHVDDLVTACVAAGERREAAGIFNVSDGNHMTSTEFLERLAAIAGLPPPNTQGLETARQLMGEKRWSFMAESRRPSALGHLARKPLTVRSLPNSPPLTSRRVLSRVLAHLRGMPEPNRYQAGSAVRHPDWRLS